MLAQNGGDVRSAFKLFKDWLVLEPGERDAWLTDIARSEPNVHGELVDIIAAHVSAEAKGFLEQNELLQIPATPDHDAAQPSEQVGSWVLQRIIGQGGMGRVWLATRAGDVTGEAAVKLLNAEHCSPEADERFAREGQFLGRLAHPRIAQLYDAGLTRGGRRYLVLEYVRGQPFDVACDERRLDVEQRLQLFLQVCEAVAYAHQQQVVHRDIKPSNVLVTPEGHVKLLDFGVAKLVGEVSGGPNLTRDGCRLCTLEYAAPEQLKLTAITTATDVYALGTMLFTVLSGINPHNAHRPDLPTAILNLHQPVPTFKAALESADPTAIATKRHTTVARLRLVLNGELQTILLKAMKTEPVERYDTAKALGDDLRRYLKKEPIQAQPDSWWYRTRKFAQRNRPQTVGAALVSLTLTMGIAATAWQWQATLQEAERTGRVLNVLSGIFNQLAPSQSQTAQVEKKELLRLGWRQASSDLARDPKARAKVAQVLGLLLSAFDDMSGAADALRVTHQHLIHTGATSSQQYLEITLELARAENRLGNPKEAKRLLTDVLRVAALLGGQRLVEPVLAEIELAAMERNEGAQEAAYQRLKRVAHTSEVELGGSHPVHLLAVKELVTVTVFLGKWTEVQKLLPGLAQLAGGSNPELRLQTLLTLGIAELKLGHFQAAASQLQRVTSEFGDLYGPFDSFSISSHLWYSIALFDAGKIVESKHALADTRRRAQASEEPGVRQRVEAVAAELMLRSNEIQGAEPLIRDALAWFLSPANSSPSDAERTRMLLGQFLLRSGHASEALTTLTEALKNQSNIYKNGHPYVFDTLTWRAIAVQTLHGVTAARPGYEAARDMAVRVLPDQHPRRLRAELYVAYATWREEQSGASRTRFLKRLQEYEHSLQDRADRTSVSVLLSRLASNRAPSEAFDYLLTLMNQ